MSSPVIRMNAVEWGWAAYEIRFMVDEPETYNCDFSAFFDDKKSLVQDSVRELYRATLAGLVHRICRVVRLHDEGPQKGYPKSNPLPDVSAQPDAFEGLHWLATEWERRELEGSNTPQFVALHGLFNDACGLALGAAGKEATNELG